MSTCVAVIGTPRSGTSLTAGILHFLGVPMAAAFAAETGIEDWNPKGMFADRDFEVELIRQFGATWPDSPAPASEEIRSLITRRNTMPLWGVKASRLPAILPTLAEMCPGLVVVATSRAKERSAASWNARKSDGLPSGEDVIAASAACVSRSLAIVPPTLTVDFDAVIDSPVSEVRRIADAVGVEFRQAAVDFVDASLRRH